MIEGENSRQFKRVILSRTDSIGDVILTLPMAGVIKKHFPACRILFLGKTYTKDLISASIHIDKFINWDELQEKSKNERIELLRSLHVDTIIHVFPDRAIAALAKKAKISMRIGTNRRYFHWNTCNKKVYLKRKNSPLHEAQLNIQLLAPMGINIDIPLEQIYQYFGLTKIKQLNTEFQSLIDNHKLNIILHPMSKGNAREWGVDNFAELINNMSEEKYTFFISGSKEEAEKLKGQLPFEKKNVVNIMGLMTLSTFISFINSVDGIVACSTGPLHIAAALNKHAIGLYAPMTPIHPRRWGPLGKYATHFVIEKKCNNCKRKAICECIRSIKAKEVIAYLESVNKVENSV